MNEQDVIDRFVAFYNEHGRGRLQVEGGVMATIGCDGKSPGCCSKSIDFEDVVAVLRSLSSAPPTPLAPPAPTRD